MKQTIKVGEGAATERLDVYLAKRLGTTRSQIQQRLKTGAITVNDQPQPARYMIHHGDTIEVAEQPSPPAAPPAPDLPIVYEDAALLVVDKPAGLTAHPGNGIHGATVADFARTKTSDPDTDRPGIVHRLDRDTSGLMVIAKTAESKLALQKLFAGHQVTKTYLLLTTGHLEPAEAVIKLPLGRARTNPLQRAVVSGGREAITQYETLEVLPGFSLVQAIPKTGRTHQIRVHFAALRHPIAGDITYGAPVRALKLRRQFLHATRLQFTSPTGAVVDVTSPLPADLAEVLERLHKQV